MRRDDEVSMHAVHGRRGRRRVVASAVVLATLIAVAGCSHAKSDAGAPRGGAPRVLLIGDSIMDQEGGAAAFALRQHGIDATRDAVWGSGLLTRDQYDFGRTRTGGSADAAAGGAVDWLARARNLVDEQRPDLVVVAMNHNHPPPFPRDANGNEIADLRSDAGRAMIEQQVEALVAELRRHGARVAFVTPPPDGAERRPTDNPIWAATLPVLQRLGVDVIDIAPAVSAPDGSRAETRADCAGTQQRVRKTNEVHYTRFGAGLAATVIADSVDAMLHHVTSGSAAPGDHAVAIVPTATGKGYWIVQCDGAVFHFGDAAAIDGVRAERAEPFVGAARAPKGLWLVGRDGTVRSVGGAPKVSFRTRPGAPVVAVASTATNDGVLAVTRDGVVHSTTNRALPSTSVARDPVGIGVAGDDIWVATRAGDVVSVLGRRSPGSVGVRAAAFTAAPTGNGAWIVHGDGTVHPIGDATVSGDARPAPIPEDVAKVLPPSTPPPITAITAAPNGGYWILRDNGKVYAIGGAPDLGGSANLALFTS